MRALLLSLTLCACSEVVIVGNDTGEDAPAAFDPATDLLPVPGAPSWEDRATAGTCGWDLDLDVDGILDELHPIETKPNGDTVERYDYGADGIIDAVVTNRVREDGLVMRRESGDADDVTWVYVYGYDAHGRRVLEQQDNAGSWTEDGGPAPDGVADREDSYHYDELGRLSGIESVNHADGITTLTTYEYAADGLGYRVSAESPIGSSVEHWAVTLDTLGRLALREQDFDGDGSFDFEWSYQYDALGRRERMIASIGDGPRNFIYGYDDQGRLGTIDFDHPAGGPIEARYTYHYDCE
ncbi:MAG: hypothetical protein JNK04_25475 [Myxococcales bacterium]|nr:hypothetical protein [Myxococcales bacterium]